MAKSIKEGVLIDSKGKEHIGVRKELTISLYWYEYPTTSGYSDIGKSVAVLNKLMQDVNQLNGSYNVNTRIGLVGAWIDPGDVEIEDQNDVNAQAREIANGQKQSKFKTK